MDPPLDEERELTSFRTTTTAGAEPPDGPQPPPNDSAERHRSGADDAMSRTEDKSSDDDVLGKQWESGASSNKRPRTDDMGATDEADSTSSSPSPPTDATRAVTPYVASKGRAGPSPSSVVSEAWHALWEQERVFQSVVADVADAWGSHPTEDEARPAASPDRPPADRTPPSSAAAAAAATTTTHAHQMQSHWAVAQVAREKTEEVLLLQRQLTQAQAQMSALDATNGALREENMQLQVRMDKTVKALRIAGQNANKARDDATHAETTAATLAERLESFQSVVKDTTQSMRALGEDHRRVSERARNVEMQLVHALAQEATLVNKCRQLETRTSEAEAKLHETKKAEQAWRGRYESAQESVHDLQLQLDRANDLQLGRRAHSEQLAKDLQQTLALLEASSRTNQESEDTLRQVQESNRQLEEQVESQATELAEYRLKSQRDKDHLNELYTKALSKAQQLEMQLEVHKATAATNEEKWKHELKRLVSALNASKGAPKSTKTATEAAAASEEGEEQGKSAPSSGSVRIPKLSEIGTSTNSSSSTALASGQGTRMNLPKLSSIGTSTGPKCCVCSQPATHGVIKTCQCGRDKCFLRAHAACASNHTTSGAGTDPRLVLCGARDEARAGDERTTGNSTSRSTNKEISSPTAD